MDALTQPWVLDAETKRLVLQGALWGAAAVPFVLLLSIGWLRVSDPARLRRAGNTRASYFWLLLGCALPGALLGAWMGLEAAPVPPLERPRYWVDMGIVTAIAIVASSLIERVLPRAEPERAWVSAACNLGGMVPAAVYWHWLRFVL